MVTIRVPIGEDADGQTIYIGSRVTVLGEDGGYEGEAVGKYLAETDSTIVLYKLTSDDDGIEYVVANNELRILKNEEEAQERHELVELVHNVPASILSDIERMDRATDLLVTKLDAIQRVGMVAITKPEINELLDALADGRTGLVYLVEKLNAKNGEPS